MKNITSYPYVFFKNKIVISSKANIPIMTNALQYGTGVFGGIRGYFNDKTKKICVFRPEDHFRRMINSLKILGVSIDFQIGDLTKILINLIKKNKPIQNIYLRPFAFADSLELSPNLARDSKFAFVMYMIPLNDYLPTNRGLSVVVSSWRRVSDVSIPARGKFSGSYINSALARKEAYDKGADEAVVLTDQGQVSEGSAENIFIVRNNMLVTPSVSDDILEGITRRSVIELAKEHDIEVVERSIDKTELYIADEIFFSGTGVQIAWVKSVDGRMIGSRKIGPVTEKIQKYFYDTVYGRNDMHKDWITEISA